MERRTFLQGTLAASAAGLAVGAGLATRTALADATPAPAATATAANAATPFDAKSVDDTLKAMAVTPETSKDITIKAPEIAENGAVVPVTISSTLPGVTEISILVAANPNPLAATFTLPDGTQPMASTRIKMSKTSDVIAIVKAGGKAYTAKQEVKVTIGGCGG